MKTKLVLTRFGSTFGTLRFVGKSWLSTLLGFTTYWDYNPTNAIHVVSPGVCTTEKILNLKYYRINFLECDVSDGSIQKGSRQAILFSS